MNGGGIDVCEDYGFSFFDNVDEPAFKLISVGKEKRYKNSYYWDNKHREYSYLFQYTLSGTGTLRSKNKTFQIEKGEAFF